ncbi:MAG: hypothetical protein A3I05_01175 [Deltaproteobacteria bacterium RIFCSPLOWO2_02_FULL_44_10]|nr:MAG: hypothetical protein A3C46_02440 [Deltaproteobacteria bacterium RIFCSPHIGHO2_02_FULL_44_16]OGQ47338.1 MAG: hypothetical protein A3I05_01175 [Deltaproteobacteria bacterium RIFCSPLOWO2_02_FULL_44_10]
MKENILFFFIFFGIACGSSTSNTSSGTDDSGGSSTSGFLMSGKLASLQVSPSLGKASSAGTVTNVIAVQPKTGGISCETGTVSSDGTFSMRLTAGRPWFFYFYDANRRGREMFMARLRSSGLDTFAPTSSTGSLDLETVTVDNSSETASSSKSHSDIISKLGLDTDTANTLADLDDVARRYRNPDVDNDGTVDCGDSSKSFMLDFHVRYNMLENGTQVTVNDMINSFFDTATTTAQYTITGIYVVYSTSFSSASTGSVTFSDSAVTTEEGGAISAGTSTSSVTNNDFGSYHSFGPNISTTSELPSGEIVFTVGSKTLTFSDVQTPSLASLTAPTGRIFPFLKLVTTDSACTSNCTLSSLSYQWMKKTSTSWTAATLAELSTLVTSSGGFLSFRLNTDSNTSQTVGITIPISAIEGTITWQASNVTLSGVTESEFLNLTTNNICHVGLSYDDQLGMRYFEGINNITGTCS